MNWHGICGEKILQILVEKSGRSFEELCDDLGIQHQLARSGLMEMYYCLLSLNEFGLITVDDIENDTETINEFIEYALRNDTGGEKIRASDKWWKMRSALTDGCFSPADRASAYSMAVIPFFGRPSKLSGCPKLFVLMPFTDELKPIYTDHIIPVANELKLSVARADDFFTHNSVISDIWTAICEAKIIIADCTGRNPNVFYEMGIAHTIGKPLILITQKSEDVPMDLRHVRYIKYDVHTGMENFKASLKSTISSALRWLK